MNEKSVLVIDTPNNCSECPCCYVSENDWGDFISARCQMKYKGFVDKYSEYNKGRPSWCPLRPLPKYLGFKDTETETTDWHFGDNFDRADGWNACLDEILGEENG